MLKYHNYDIVFQEVPNEVTLAINITSCPNNCVGCHSRHLQADSGILLTDDRLDALIASYGSAITCLCFMGGDSNPDEIMRLASHIKRRKLPIKIAWYSGCDRLPKDFDLYSMNYIKLGSYIEKHGGLCVKETNQKMYKIENGSVMTDITHLFWK